MASPDDGHAGPPASTYHPNSACGHVNRVALFEHGGDVTNGAENTDPLALVDQIIAQLRQAMAHIGNATALAGTVRDTLSGVSSTQAKALLIRYAQMASVELDCIMAHIQAATAWANSVQATVFKPVEAGVEHPVQPPFNTRQSREDLQAEHRRAHRSGRPGKIEGDPELEAFILARIDTLTFAQIV